MEHIGNILPGFLVDLMGRDPNHTTSIICRKTAIVEQLEELAEHFKTAEPEEVFRLQLDTDRGTTTITIDRYKEVRDRLPGTVTDEQVQEAFARMFGSDEK